MECRPNPRRRVSSQDVEIRLIGVASVALFAVDLLEAGENGFATKVVIHLKRGPSAQ